jgi:hypothetical protein
MMGADAEFVIEEDYDGPFLAAGKRCASILDEFTSPAVTSAVNRTVFYHLFHADQTKGRG